MEESDSSTSKTTEESVSGPEVDGIILGEVSLCKSIENNLPVDPSTTFQESDGKIWLYTRFFLEEGRKEKIKHIWYFEGEMVGERELGISGPSFRTNSYKSIHEGMTGKGKVEITTQNGELIKTLKYTVK